MPYMFEYSNGQPRVRWPELQRLELEPALRILGDTIERFLHGVMEGSTGGILLHDDVHHTLVNVAADNCAQAEAQETADEAHVSPHLHYLSVRTCVCNKLSSFNSICVHGGRNSD